MSDPDIPNTHSIKAHMHCGRCLKEMPSGVSPREWQRVEVGWTKEGLQVWCTRHNINVMHVHFQGQKHPANTTIAAEPQPPITH